MMILEEQKSTTNIDFDKFNKVFNIYFSFLKNKKSVNISSLLPVHTDYKNAQTPLELNPLDFFLWISSEINSVYTTEELKKNGQFHTNNLVVVNLILDNAIHFNSDSLIDKKILEPSCGTGIFILAIIQRLYDKGYTKEKLTRFVNNNIVGFDISYEMVYFTKLNIYCLMSCLFNDSNIISELKPKIFVTDTTYKPDVRIEQLDLFNSELSFVETEEAKNIKLNCVFGDKFDYIVGNPPYVTLYGRRDMKKT
ncbi:N-6 DNA methylase, partial [Paenibacillus sp. TAF58]